MQAVGQHLAVMMHFFDANLLMLIAAFTFGSVFFAALAVMQFAEGRQAVRRRAIAFHPASPNHAIPGFGEAARRLGSHLPRDFENVAELLFSVEKALSGGKDKDVSRIRRELITAGYFRADALYWFYAARFVMAFSYGLSVLLMLARFFPDTPMFATACYTAAGACVGLQIPGIFLRFRQKKMQRECRNGFPNFLDLLVVSAESGLSPRAGIERVSREIALTHPYLGANLFLMSLELRAGMPLAEAVEALGRRVQIDEVRSLGSLLHQTEELGTKLSDALRVFSDEMRARRLLRAEEKAHALPVKLVLPLAFFVFPVMLLVVLLPVFIRIHRALL
jgi:tight adherence protein C